MKTILTFIISLIITSFLQAEILFEVKDELERPVLEVSEDGLRIFNPAQSKDTLMAITKDQIVAYASADLNRGFDIEDVGFRKDANGTLLSIAHKFEPNTIINDSTMLWYKKDNAFRVGHVRLNPDSVGQASFAAGGMCQAGGTYSAAFGYESNAEGHSSFATGYKTNALGRNSFATGLETNASGSHSFTSGQWTTASGIMSASLGYETIASGNYSTAIGRKNDAIGECSIATGFWSRASGYCSTSLGYKAYSNADYSTAIGMAPNATGDWSIAIGNQVTAQSFSSLVTGRFNITEGDSTAWQSSDPLFVVGNGSSIYNRSNAFEVKKNGDAYIPSIVTYSNLVSNYTYDLGVNSEGKLVAKNPAPKTSNENAQKIENLEKENEELKIRLAKLEKIVNKLVSE